MKALSWSLANRVAGSSLIAVAAAAVAIGTPPLRNWSEIADDRDFAQTSA
jgi:hypothetical protein